MIGGGGLTGDADSRLWLGQTDNLDLGTKGERVLETSLGDQPFLQNPSAHWLAMLPQPPPSPPLDPFETVHIRSLAAALAKLNIKVQIEDLLKAVHEEDEAWRAESAAEEAQLRAAMSKRQSTTNSLPAPDNRPV